MHSSNGIAADHSSTVCERLTASQEGILLAQTRRHEAHVLSSKARAALSIALEAGDANAIAHAEGEAVRAQAEENDAARAVMSFQKAAALMKDVKHLVARRESLDTSTSNGKQREIQLLKAEATLMVTAQS